MRTILLIIACLILARPHALAQQEFVNPLPQPNTLMALQFADEAHGWALGESGTLLRTTDGGASWSLSYLAIQLPSGPLALSFADRMHGWVAAGIRQGGDRSWVFRTVDGGATWDSLPYSVNGIASDILFADARHGWMVGEFGIRRTTDGGEHWDAPERVGYGDLRSIAALDSVNIWVAGLFGLIINSSDGGATWSVRRQGDKTTAGSTTHFFNTITFSDPLNGWVAGTRLFGGTSYGACIFHTSDGGSTWSEQLQLPRDAWTQSFTDLSFGDARHGIAVAARGTIMATADGGVTWETRHEETDKYTMRDLNAVRFLDDRRAWAVGGDGHMFSTSDAGEHWSEFSSGIPAKDSVANFYAVHFIDSLHGFASGAFFDAMMYETVDAGRTWLRRDDYLHRNDVSVIEHFLDRGPHDLWGVGFEGTIVHSTDDGATWQRRESGAVANLMGIAFPSATEGWIVSGAPYNATGPGTILHTNDGGERWQRFDSARIPWFDVQFTSREKGWIVGDSATVLRTSDGGAHWERMRLENGARLYDLEFIDETRGWIVGEQGMIFSTFDGGTTWERRQVDPILTLRSVSFADRDHGWAVGDGGAAFYSNDGGRSWRRVALHLTRALYGVELASGGDGWIVGWNGLLLRIHGTPAAAVPAIIRAAERLFLE